MSRPLPLSCRSPALPLVVLLSAGALCACGFGGGTSAGGQQGFPSGTSSAGASTGATASGSTAASGASGSASGTAGTGASTGGVGASGNGSGAGASAGAGSSGTSAGSGLSGTGASGSLGGSGGGSGAASTGSASGTGTSFMYPDGGPPPIVVDPANVLPTIPLTSSMCGLPAMPNTATTPTKFFGSHGVPLPTNVFWMNMVVQNGDNITPTFPYHVTAQSNGLGVAKPEMLTVSTTYVYEAAPAQLTLGAAEGIQSRVVSSWDPLSVTLTFQEGAGTMTTPIVYGMPYVTAIYAGLTPKITAGIFKVNGTTTGSATAARFDMLLSDGQEWIVYASQPAAATWTQTALTFSSPLKGWVRVARANAAMPPATLDQYAGAVPTGGQIRLSTSGNTGVVEFSWQSMGTGSLLVMALPHHMDHLAQPTVAPNASFTTVRGTLHGIVGSLWQLQYPLSTVLRAAPRPVDPTHLAAVQAALDADKGYQPGAAGSYDFGKSVGHAAQLLLIAEALGQTTIANQLRQTIENVLGPWVAGKGADPLVCDTTWGGVVAGNAINNAQNDFGNGIYNDHHFHYGYLLYAAGAVAKGDPAWAMQYQSHIVDLIRDIANPSPNDPYFPQFRVFDWYDGHSWASGVWPFGEGRNQESSSEAFNAWVGLSLWGDAVGNANLMNLGRLLRAVEAASVQRYYHVHSNSDIYPAPFTNNRGVGILWSSKADFSNFFGGGTPQTYAIQMLPMTMASEELIDAPWIQDAWPVLSSVAGTDGWGGLIDMTHAVIDKTSAWTQLTTVGVEVGNSRTNMLYWGATRP